MSTYIPYGKQDIQPEDIEAVIKALQSDWLTQGPMIGRFEQSISDYCRVNYAVAVVNATAALHLACLALGVTKGDVVWTSPITFVASANCALYCGAGVDFVDIDPDSYNLSVEKLEEKLILARKNNCLPKVVIPVHFSGQSCDMRAIRKLADEYGFYIIEDASHAIGGHYDKQPVGCCVYSDITVFSFHPVKIITTGEGGVATTKDANIAQKLRLLRSHGITRDHGLMSAKPEGGWYYEQIDLGFNYRITDLQCALGVEQMKRLDLYVTQRNQLAHLYNEKLKSLAIKIPVINDKIVSSWHLYVIQLDQAKIVQTRAEVFKYMRDRNIGVNVHYVPVHLQPYYQKLGFKLGDYPVAENYYSQAITLPLFPMLTHQDMDRVVACLKEAL